MFKKPIVIEKPTVDPSTLPAKTPQEYFARGMAFYARQELTRAQDDFHQAISLDAGYVEGHYGLGLALKAQKRKAEAIQAFRKVLDLVTGGAFKDDKNREAMMRRIVQAHLESLGA
jgi:tetratricopeptide (TPR) repeat protein